MTTKKILVPLMTLVLVSGIFLAVPQAYAQSTTTTQHQGFFQGMIQFLENKFGLDKTQVQSAISDYRAQQKATITPRPTMSAQQIDDKEKTRLDKLVTDKKITSDQEQKILTELSTLRSKYNTDSMSADQRRTQMLAMMNELNTWAKAQGIDPKYVMMGPEGLGKREWRGLGRPHGSWGGKPSASPSATPTP